MGFRVGEPAVFEGLLPFLDYRSQCLVARACLGSLEVGRGRGEGLARLFQGVSRLRHRLSSLFSERGRGELAQERVDRAVGILVL